MPSSTLSRLAPTGSTGNNTHSGVGVGSGDVAGQVGFQFVVEAIGATPTITWKVQGSLDGLTWFDVFYVTTATDTPATAAIVATTVSTVAVWLSNGGASRFYSQYRVVTSANTNVTYHAEMYVQATS